MARLYKCQGCDNKFEKELLQKISNKNYCASCHNKIIVERQQREELYNVIKELYSVDYPTGWMLKQIKDYTEIRGYKIKGIMLTLLYCKEQLNLRFNTKYGLGIIPSYYESAKEYWLEKQKRIENHKDIEIKPIVITIPNIKVDNEYKKNKIIDLEDLACRI